MLFAEPVQGQILEIDSLLALKGLATATSRLGLTYEEYASQLRATRRAVEPFLRSPGGAPSVIPMALALAYYELAAATWRPPSNDPPLATFGSVSSSNRTTAPARRSQG
jgi:hypothetical protein